MICNLLLAIVCVVKKAIGMNRRFADETSGMARYPEVGWRSCVNSVGCAAKSLTLFVGLPVLTAATRFTRARTVGISRSSAGDMFFNQRHHLGIELISSTPPTYGRIHFSALGSAAINCSFS